MLPFVCFSEEREFKFLTEAMSEDLITMLARIPGFIVIARQSAFAYQGRSVDSRQIGRFWVLSGPRRRQARSDHPHDAARAERTLGKPGC
ncbi:hypothetical protein [Bradyrhizobium sp. BR 10261]|uniref:hypothetical protein n=1 Tax=Bradyrhizobium sp. BR 10261 TaxID=2749992 RepID=UPI001C65408A|nr:hypothetical protein [Bradyrhizobium sp. BR 10261]MBW7961009.1 hypothetical protein [Bradyrhizobium sp. BR 10261]